MSRKLSALLSLLALAVAGCAELPTAVANNETPELALSSSNSNPTAKTTPPKTTAVEVEATEVEVAEAESLEGTEMVAEEVVAELATSSDTDTPAVVASLPDTSILTDPVAQDAFVRAKMREHIGYDPLLEIIAACETTGTTHRIAHWNPDGSLVKNPTSSASGAAQVLLYFHRDWIAAEGRNMQDIDDYMQFVRTLFERQGYGAWNESRSCWGRYRHEQYAQM